MTWCCVSRMSRLINGCHGALHQECKGNLMAWCSVSRMSRELKDMVLCVKNVKGIKGHGALFQECQGN